MREDDDADRSGNTAQFRAFVDGAGSPDGTQPWAMNAPRNHVARLATIVIAVAILLALVAFLVIR